MWKDTTCLAMTLSQKYNTKNFPMPTPTKDYKFLIQLIYLEFISTPKNRQYAEILFSVRLLARTSITDLFSRCRPLHSLTSCLRGVTMYVLHDYASIPNIFHTHNNKTQSLSNKWIEIGFGDDRCKPNIINILSIRILIENYDLRTPLILV